MMGRRVTSEGGKKRCHIHTNTISPPKQSLCNSGGPVGTVIVVIMLKLMLHSYSCASCIVIRFFFFFPQLKFLLNASLEHGD